MKKILVSALTSALLLSTMAVPASAETTIDSPGKHIIVSMMDFENVTEAPAEGTSSLTNAQLANMGITADIDDKADVTVVELDGNKVLKFDPNNTESTGAKLDIPLNYTLNNDEKLYVEFDWKYESDLTGWNSTEKPLLDVFSGDIGTVGLVRIFTGTGGNGQLYELFGKFRNSANTADIRKFNEIQNGHNGTQVDEWLHTSQKYDKAAYELNTAKDAQNGGAVITTTTKASGNVYLTGDYNIHSYPTDGIVKELTFSNSNGMGCIYIDNITVYAINKMTSTGLKERNKYVDNKTAELTFSNNVDDVSALEIKAGSETLVADTDYTTEINNNKVTVTFVNNLLYDTEYTFDVNGVKDTFNQAVTGADVYSFTTEATPDIYVPADGLKLMTGFGEGELANNDLGGVELTLKNNASAEKTVSAIYMIYDANNCFKNVLVTKVKLDGNEQKTITTGLWLDGVSKVKTYIWDTVTNMKPYVRSVSVDGI